MLVGVLMLALLVPVQGGSKEPARKPNARDYKGGHAGRDADSEEAYGGPRRMKREGFRAPDPTPDGWVSTRFRPEHSIYFNSGRWTTYPDDIYLDPQQDAVYVIATFQGAAPRMEGSDDISAFTAEVFEKYRKYANQICPRTNRERLTDPEFRKKFEVQYERAQRSQKELLNRTITFEQYLDMAPDCDVCGNLWRTATRFAEVGAGQEGMRRLMIRFPNDAAIRSFLNSESNEDYLPLLKAHLQKENKIIVSPLEPKNEPR